jgi:hypothetical protein
MKAYVLIQTTTETSTIADEVNLVPGVIAADDLQGPYDAIALIASDRQGLRLQNTLDTIKELTGVTRAVVAPVSDTLAPPGDVEAA